jgi:hypothetical protein
MSLDILTNTQFSWKIQLQFLIPYHQNAFTFNYFIRGESVVCIPPTDTHTHTHTVFFISKGVCFHYVSINYVSKDGVTVS